MPDRTDTAELTREADRPFEALGEINESRFQGAPADVRGATDAALDRAFPEAQD